MKVSFRRRNQTDQTSVGILANQIDSARGVRFLSRLAKCRFLPRWKPPPRARPNARPHRTMQPLRVWREAKCDRCATPMKLALMNFPGGRDPLPGRARPHDLRTPRRCNLIRTAFPSCVKCSTQKTIAIMIADGIVGRPEGMLCRSRSTKNRRADDQRTPSGNSSIALSLLSEVKNGHSHAGQE